VSLDPVHVAAEIDAEAAIRSLQALVQIPGTTGDERRVAEHVAESLRRAGARVTVDRHWNVVGEVGSQRGPGLLLLTHTDSGPAGAMEDPYSGETRDGAPFGKTGPVVYGRGACAPKASIAAMVAAMAALARHGDALPGRVQMAAVVKDLAANHEGVRQIDAAGLVQADVCIAGEPSNNAIVLGARGIAHYEVEFTGVPTHWGRPRDGANPLYALGAFVLELERVELPTDPVLGAATLAPFAVDSTAVPPRTPGRCRVMVDRRVLPGESPETIGRSLQDLADRIAGERRGIGGHVRAASGMFPYAVPEGAPIVRLVERAVRAALGRAPEHTYITFSSNAGYLIRERNLPSLAFGPGRIEDAGEREHVAVDDVVAAAKVYAAAAVIAGES